MLDLDGEDTKPAERERIIMKRADSRETAATAHNKPREE